MNSYTVMPVLIVGAGPTGMTVALDLAHYGIPSIILDEDYRLSGGSRAIAFHHSALAVWEKLGAAEAMLDLGVRWSVRHTYHGLKHLYTQDLGRPGEGYLPRFINIPQYDVERFLLERVSSNPFIELRWDHKVVGCSQNDSSVTLTVETSKGQRKLGGQFVLACDGARSTMRKLLNLDFPGRTFNDYFLIADIKSDLGFPPEPRFYFDHPTSPGHTVLIHPQPGGIWRIDWQIGSKVEPAAESDSRNMDRRIRALIGDKHYEIVWLSTYRFHQRLLDQFKHGRIFFAGDAAHLVAPFGARGLNSAIQDVENLAWKLAFVLKGQASPEILDSYQLERWPAQAENQRVTLNTMRFMAPDTFLLKLKRNLILWLSSFYPPARRWVNSGRLSIPFVYTASPLITPDHPGDRWKKVPSLGAKIPDLPVAVFSGSETSQVFLRKLIGNGFIAFYFAKNGADARDFLTRMALTTLQVSLKVLPVLNKNVQDLESIVDRDRSFSKLMDGKAGSLYLVRPDGHLALRKRKAALEDLTGYFTGSGRFE